MQATGQGENYPGYGRMPDGTGECLVRRDVMLPVNSEESMALLCRKATMTFAPAESAKLLMAGLRGSTGCL